MSQPGMAPGRIWATLRAALALACAVGLWLIHPGWPHLYGSLTSPLTTGEFERIVLCLAWLLCVCLAFAVLVGATRILVHGSTSVPATLPGVLPGRASGQLKRKANRPAAHGRYTLTIPVPLAEARAPEDSSPAPDLPVDREAPPSDPCAISIAVLGPLVIDGLARRIKRGATYEVLAYLALHPKGASRDELIEAIWPAQDPKRTRPRFWQSVTEARKALGDAWLHEGERYQLDRSRVRVDLDDLDRLLTASRGDADPEALEEALALWRGEPLDGSDYLWADGEIRSLRATLLDLLERVGRGRLARGEARGALQIAEQAIALDGLHEPSWRLALQAEHSLGLRESITRRYDELARSLDEQLGLEPARETRAIYRELLGQT
jgi:DNA-binding SARP family transcriptional activator